MIHRVAWHPELQGLPSTRGNCARCGRDPLRTPPQGVLGRSKRGCISRPSNNGWRRGYHTMMRVLEANDHGSQLIVWCSRRRGGMRPRMEILHRRGRRRVFAIRPSGINTLAADSLTWLRLCSRAQPFDGPTSTVIGRCLHRDVGVSEWSEWSVMGCSAVLPFH